MRIGLDYINALGVGGLSTYSQNLIESLALIDEENQYFLGNYCHDFLPGRSRQKFNNPNFKLAPVYVSPLGLSLPEKFMAAVNRRSVKLNYKLRRLDFFHFTNPLNYVLGVKCGIVTIHDLALLHNRTWAKDYVVSAFVDNIGKIIGESKRIIADSEFTKNDIVKFFSTDEKKISVIHLAASAKYYPDIDREYLAAEFGLKNFIFYAGQLQPRKNILRLLEAYSLLPNDLKDRYQLILAGRPRNQEFLSEINKALERFNLVGQVKIMGFVSNTDLRKLYSCAKFFVYPSLFEGFGLPILEAYNCGTPVITSNTSSLPEVAGTKAAILVDPEDVKTLGAAMEKLLVDQELYESLKSHALLEAKKFSWQATAEKTKAVYEDVYRELKQNYGR